MEIIVPVGPFLADGDNFQRAYPAVRFVSVDWLPTGADPTHPGLAHLIYDRQRSAGLAAARGEIVALTEDQIIPEPDWCAAIAAAHGQPHDAIGGAIQNAGPGVLHAAVYLCDFGRYQNPLPAGEAESLSDQNVSYKRAALERVRHTWKDFYHEPAVHQAIRTAGGKLWVAPEMVVRLDRSRLTLRQQLRERFAWGRVYGGKRAQMIAPWRRAALIVAAPVIPPLICWRVVSGAVRKQWPVRELLVTLPAVMLLALFWSAGEVAGYVTRRPFNRTVNVKY